MVEPQTRVFVVEYLAHHPKVEGSSPTTATSTGSKKMAKIRVFKQFCQFLKVLNQCQEYNGRTTDKGVCGRVLGSSLQG